MEVSLTNIIELALQQGIWAALYIYLFFRMLSENKEREDKYQTIIDRLSGNIEQGIEDIQERLEQLAAKNKMTQPDTRAAYTALSSETLGAALFCEGGAIWASRHMHRPRQTGRSAWSAANTARRNGCKTYAMNDN